jgi:hypothetical protein
MSIKIEYFSNKKINLVLKNKETMDEIISKGDKIIYLEKGINLFYILKISKDAHPEFFEAYTKNFEIKGISNITSEMNIKKFLIDTSSTFLTRDYNIKIPYIEYDVDGINYKDLQKMKDSFHESSSTKISQFLKTLSKETIFNFDNSKKLKSKEKKVINYFKQWKSKFIKFCENYELFKGNSDTLN